MQAKYQIVNVGAYKSPLWIVKQQKTYGWQTRAAYFKTRIEAELWLREWVRKGR